MKKVLLIMLMLASAMFAKAQNNLELNIADIENNQYWALCVADYDSIVVVSDDQPCTWSTEPNPFFGVSIQPYGSGEGFSYNGNRFAFALGQGGQQYEVYYQGCREIPGGTQLYYKYFYFFFYDFQVPEPWTQNFKWKRKGASITLEAPQNPVTNDCSYLWSTGSTNQQITVNQPGTYWVHIYNDCGELYDTIQVRDNVELYRATVDLETNLNKVTWQVTNAQSEYISEVKVYRDGSPVGTAPYQDGYYLDAIGSDNAARNYKIVGISAEGPVCPITSFEKGTIHTTYYQDVNGNLNMTWNIPYVATGAQGTLANFQICKYNPNTGGLTVVDQVNSSITDYTCGVNQFDGGYAVIAAKFNGGKGVEELSFSNLTTDILGVGENALNTFSIYPNPAQDRITVEGTGRLSITNALGQTILTQEIDGKTSIELPKGLYFAKMGNTVRKVVVE